MHSFLRRGPLLVVAAIALFAVGGAAFAAANTTPPSSAGEETSAVVSGFTISSIVYVLDGTDPQNIDSVTYTAQSGAASGWPASLTTLVTRFTVTAGEWYVCTDAADGAASGAYSVTCVTDGTGGGNFFYDGATAGVQLTVLNAVEFDTVLVQ